MKAEVKLFIVNGQRVAKEVGPLEVKEIKFISFGDDEWEIHVIYRDGDVHIYPACQFTEFKAKDYNSGTLLNLGTLNAET